MEQTTFMDEHFLLHTKQARALYHDQVGALPIIDFHNHLSPKDIAENRQFNNLTELWLEGDHYKWRVMRWHGVPEKYCTGNASPEEKFMAWAEVVPATVRNPLFHWTHLELQRYFGIRGLLNASNAFAIYQQANEMLHDPAFFAQGLLSGKHVEVICTTDDPIDTLQYHRLWAGSNNTFKMYPTFRPDNIYRLADAEAYNKYIDALAGSAGITIASYDQLLMAIATRVEYFHLHGCRIADHGLEQLSYQPSSEALAAQIFGRIRSGQTISREEQQHLRSSLLLFLCQQYQTHGWVQQFHLGAQRNNNAAMLWQLGADAGFDSMGDGRQAAGMASFFNELNNRNALAKTILYNINPSDNEVFATMCGNFNVDKTPGYFQWGAAWWFNDQKEGIEGHLNTLSNQGILSDFVGMVTDSRSLMSFPRHEYFRRILCNLLGDEMNRGEIPNDVDYIGKLLKQICYDNAVNYFPWPHMNKK